MYQTLPLEAFSSNAASYQLMPLRFARLPGIENEVLIVSDAGEWLFLDNDTFESFVAGNLPMQSDTYLDLASKQFCSDSDPQLTRRIAATKYATKKAFLRNGPDLHIFVVTLRCNHSCHYCQVSRRMTQSTEHDMSPETALAAIDRLFESPSGSVTVEFQGGEPLIAFGMIRFIVEEIERRNRDIGKSVRFTVTSTLHHLNDEIADFLKRHNFHISTSIDGPAALHDINRPATDGHAFAATTHGLSKAREYLGHEGVVALTTLTRNSLATPKAIIDEYVELGFRSIFLRPLSPFGFAVRARGKIGYSMSEFLTFYSAALDHIIELNRQGTEINEVYTSLLLKHILTPWQSGYVDLRSPAGPALGVLVYNYDGGVYASDEARMLAEVGDQTFRLGNVHDNLQRLYASDAMKVLLASGVVESLPGCSDCAYLPFCGADPVFHYATQGDPIGHRPTSEFCRRHMGLFEILFRHLRDGDPFVIRTFHRWASGLSNQRLNSVEAA